MSAGLVRALDRAIGAVAAALALAGGLCLAGLVAVTVVGVVARYLFNDPIFGIEDVSSMLLAVIVAAAIVFGARRGAHVSVDVLARHIGPGVSRIVDRVVRAVGALTVGTAAWALAAKGSCGFPCGAFTANLEILHRPFYFALALAFGLYALQLALEAVAGPRDAAGGAGAAGGDGA